MEWNNKTDVVATTPMSNQRSVELSITDKNIVPEGKKGYFFFSAGHDKGQKWKLIIKKGRENIN